MSPSLLFVQPITNLVWNRARGDVLQPEVRPFTFSSQTGKTVDTCNISVTFILIRPITAKIRTTTILGDPGAVTRGYGPIDLHESRPLISLDPITCTTYCFRDRGIVMSPSLLFVQPITNLVWNRARGDVLQPEVRPFTFSSQTGKTVDTCNISVTFILIRPITAKIRTTTILGDPGAVTRVERKGVTKVFKHRPKSPWVPTLTGPFPNVPNQQTVSREFFS